MNQDAPARIEKILIFSVISGRFYGRFSETFWRIFSGRFEGLLNNQPEFRHDKSHFDK